MSNIKEAAPAVTKSEKKKKSEVTKYTLHIGKMIKDHLDITPDLTLAKFVKESGMGTTTIVERFKNPYYGTTYDLLDACIIMKMDFISPLLKVLSNGRVLPKWGIVSTKAHKTHYC